MRGGQRGLKALAAALVVAELFFKVTDRPSILHQNEMPIND